MGVNIYFYKCIFKAEYHTYVILLNISNFMNIFARIYIFILFFNHTLLFISNDFTLLIQIVTLSCILLQCDPHNIIFMLDHMIQKFNIAIYREYLKLFR